MSFCVIKSLSKQSTLSFTTHLYIVYKLGGGKKKKVSTIGSSMRSIISKMSHSCTILNCNTDKISQQARKEEETEPVSAEEEKAGQIEIHFINAANVLLCQLKLNVTTTFLMYRIV